MINQIGWSDLLTSGGFVIKRRLVCSFQWLPSFSSIG